LRKVLSAVFQSPFPRARLAACRGGRQPPAFDVVAFPTACSPLRVQSGGTKPAGALLGAQDVMSASLPIASAFLRIEPHDLRRLWTRRDRRSAQRIITAAGHHLGVHTQASGARRRNCHCRPWCRRWRVAADLSCSVLSTTRHFRMNKKRNRMVGLARGAARPHAWSGPLFPTLSRRMVL